MSKLITPYHYRIYEHEGTRWFIRDAIKVFYNATDQPLDLYNVEQQLREQAIIFASIRLSRLCPV